eukprot:8726099-Pyramimonas_sp.AAC.1
MSRESCSTVIGLGSSALALDWAFFQSSNTLSNVEGSPFHLRLHALALASMRAQESRAGSPRALISPTRAALSLSLFYIPRPPNWSC